MKWFGFFSVSLHDVVSFCFCFVSLLSARDEDAVVSFLGGTWSRASPHSRGRPDSAPFGALRLVALGRGSLVWAGRAVSILGSSICTGVHTRIVHLR